MIIAFANPKGGTGKTTLVRALAGTIAHRGDPVLLIDADSRGNTMRWMENSKRIDRWPSNISAMVSTDATEIYEKATEAASNDVTVFIDLEGTTNENLFAGLYCAHQVVIPMQISADDVISGLQLATQQIPLVEKERGAPLASIVVLNQNDFVTGRSKSHEPLREILAESDISLSKVMIARRGVYSNLASGGTLQNGEKIDPKAIGEMESLLEELEARQKDIERMAA